ncbi:hypothetical protein CVT24_003149 [Panaeolus cyanescens]|uniref:Uncharacterized protein n=1 Tax=Panaeolus cyanescens TaxID=181874 RepID=A0A409VNM2_9AGAR|nr:hypothetical protein CVT24_003149 [Panaeolus cyanescens]
MNTSRPPPPSAQGHCSPGGYMVIVLIGFFRNVSVYNDGGASKLAVFSIVLGSLYMAVVAIEVFGIFAAATQKLPFVRMYAYLSVLVTLIAIAIGLLRTIIHFTNKSDIIGVCTNLAVGSRVVVYTGFWGPIRQDVLSKAEAEDWCTRSWNRGSWSEILAFLIISLLAAFLTAVAFNYFRQVLDPTSPANVSREPQQQRMDAYPSHYNPPYNPFAPPPPNQPYYPYPPPAGPPPGQNADAFIPPYDNKPPGYVRGDDYKGGYGEMNKTDRDDEGPSERDVTNRENSFR